MGRDYSSNSNYWRGDFLFTSSRFNFGTGSGVGSGVGTGVQMSPTGPTAINIRSFGSGAPGPSGFAGGYSPSIQVSETNINPLFGVQPTSVVDWSILFQASLR